MKKCYSHGEMNIFESDLKVPKDSELLKPLCGKYIIAKSTSTGNDHCIESKKGVKVFKKNNVFYVKSTVSFNAFCVLKDRHDSITLEKGSYEIEAAKEFDYYEMQKRSVDD